MFPDSSLASIDFFWIWILFLLIAGPILTSLFSGWFALGRRFRAKSGPFGEVRSVGPFFVMVRMRMQRYGSMFIQAADDGLYLSMPFIFRLGHPPLFIPWKEIKFGRDKFFWMRCVLLTLGDEERVPMRISEGIADKLGLQMRFPDATDLSTEPNFDTLSDSFVESLKKKSS